MAVRDRLTAMGATKRGSTANRMRRWLRHRVIDLREILGDTEESVHGFLLFIGLAAIGALTLGSSVPAEWGWRALIAAAGWGAIWRLEESEVKLHRTAPAQRVGWLLVGVAGFGAVIVTSIATHTMGLPGWAVVAGSVFAAMYSPTLGSAVLARIWPAANPMGWYADLVAAERHKRVRRRRRAIEARGLSGYVVEEGRVIHTDVDGLGEERRLWRAARPGGDTPLVMVEVLNSTPEPAGTRRTYWLRVPPTTDTCQAAVAWTFGIERHEDYHPLAES